ncbi:hypothetical protein AAE478_003293 [Parahypoxylon ruwenzoriense]
MTTAAVLPSDHPQLQDYRQLLKHNQVSRSSRLTKNHANRVRRSRKRLTFYTRWDPEEEDSRRLAADPNVFLPSDRSPSKPRLERQEAFRETKIQEYHSDVVADDAELYRLGLLYDDDHVRGSGFNLDTIDHSDPIYLVRPAKRAKRQRAGDSYLYLDISFASLGSNVDSQQFLAPEVVQLPTPTDDDDTATQDRWSDYFTGQGPSYANALLSVIHELPESSSHSLSISAPAATDFLGLISGSERGGGGDEEDGSDDWALLEAEILSTTDTDIGVDAEDTVDITSATEGAWIVLGDGS